MNRNCKLTKAKEREKRKNNLMIKNQNHQKIRAKGKIKLNNKMKK
jgi:hypothetical protein